jgi:hypothetical protein
MGFSYIASRNAGKTAGVAFRGIVAFALGPTPLLANETKMAYPFVRGFLTKRFYVLHEKPKVGPVHQQELLR